MATTTATSGATGADFLATLGKKDKTAAQSLDEAQDRFLTLYITQLRNQDPLNPLDNAQVTTQLAQMNTVKGIENLNTTLSKLVDMFSGGQAMQATSMIGKSVLIPGSSMELQGGIAIGGVELAEAADQINVAIKDANGLLLRTLALGPQPAGSHVFGWDGKTEAGANAVEGKYSYAIEATRAGKAISATALQAGTVSAVVRANGGFQLDLGSAGTASFDDVREIL